MIDLEDQPLVFVVFAFPVVDAARSIPGRCAWIQISSSCGRIQRHQRIVAREHVHDVADYDRVEQIGFGSWVGYFHATCSLFTFDFVI